LARSVLGEKVGQSVRVIVEFLIQISECNCFGVEFQQNRLTLKAVLRRHSTREHLGGFLNNLGDFEGPDNFECLNRFGCSIPCRVVEILIEAAVVHLAF
jgi:hypothetical protein